MRAHVVKTCSDPQESLQAFAHWIADLDGLTPGQAAQRDTAERYLGILTASGVADMAGAALDVSLLRAAGYDESSPEWIACQWFRSFAVHGAARARSDLGLSIETDHEMGRLEERMWWRAAHEPVTGKSPERLALVGKRQTKAGQDGSAMKAGQSFAAQHGSEAQARADELAESTKLNWAAIKRLLAVEFRVSPETIKRTVANPRK